MRKKLSKKFLAVAAALVASSTVMTACGSGSGGAADSSSGLKLAVILPLSGQYSSLGIPEQKSLKAFESIAKKQYGVDLNLKFYNNQSDATQSASLARTAMADSSVDGIIGGASQALMLAEFPILSKAKVPYLVLTPQQYPNYNKEPWVFSGSGASVPQQTQATLNYLKSQNIDPSDAVAVGSDNATGQYTKDPMKQAGYGDVVLIPDSVSSMDSQVAEFKHNGVKAIYTFQSAPSAGKLRKSAASMNVPFLVAAGSFGQSYMNATGDSAAGSAIITTQAFIDPSAIQDPDAKAAVSLFQTTFQKAEGSQPVLVGGTTSVAWDAGLSFVLAAKDAKKIDRQSLRDAMDTQTFQGVNGKITRSSSDHFGLPDTAVVVAQLDADGKLKPGASVGQ